MGNRTYISRDSSVVEEVTKFINEKGFNKDDLSVLVSRCLNDFKVRNGITVRELADLIGINKESVRCYLNFENCFNRYAFERLIARFGYATADECLEGFRTLNYNQMLERLYLYSHC